MRAARPARTSTTCSVFEGLSTDHTEGDVDYEHDAAGRRPARPDAGSTAGSTTSRCATRTPCTPSSTARSGSPTSPTSSSADDVGTLPRTLPDEGHPVAVRRPPGAGRGHRVGPPARAGRRRRPAARAVPRRVRRRAHRARAVGVLRGRGRESPTEDDWRGPRSDQSGVSAACSWVSESREAQRAVDPDREVVRVGDHHEGARAQLVEPEPAGWWTSVPARPWPRASGRVFTSWKRARPSPASNRPSEETSRPSWKAPNHWPCPARDRARGRRRGGCENSG